MYCVLCETENIYYLQAAFWKSESKVQNVLLDGVVGLSKKATPHII